MEYSSRTDQRGRPLLAENTTLARRLSALRSFMKFYYTIGAIRQNPAMFISMPKIASHEIIALDPADVDLILKTARGTEGLTKKQILRRRITEKRDIAILVTLLGTGIRVSELVGLDTKSVDFRSGMITVTLKGGNDGHSFFGPEVEAALRDYIENGRPLLKPAVNDDALFLSVRHQRMTVRAVELLVKDYTERAGIANAQMQTGSRRISYGRPTGRSCMQTPETSGWLRQRCTTNPSKRHRSITSKILRSSMIRY